MKKPNTFYLSVIDCKKIVDTWHGWKLQVWAQTATAVEPGVDASELELHAIVEVEVNSRRASPTTRQSSLTIVRAVNGR